MTADTIHRDGVAIMMVSAITFSTAGLFTKGVEADAWSVIFWRGLFATAFMAAYACCRGGFDREFRHMGWPGVAVAIASTSGMLAFITSFKLTSIANVSLIYATGPFLSAAFAWIWFRERPGTATAVASLASIAGVAVIVGGSAAGFGDGTSIGGDLLALWMTCMLSIIMVIYRRYPGTPAIGPTAVSALAALPISAAFGNPLAAPVDEILIIAAFGLVFSVAAVTMLEGARRLPPAEASLISALETPLAPVWAWMILAELPPRYTVIGGGIILAAVFGSLAWSLRRDRAAARRRPATGLSPTTPLPSGTASAITPGAVCTEISHEWERRE